MARIEEFDYGLVQHVQQEVNEVLRQIGEAHGINIELLRVRYDRYGFRGYIEAQIVPEDGHGGNGIDWRKKYQDEFLRHGKKYGFEAKHLRATFQVESGIYKLVGLQTRAKEFKILGENSSGRVFRFKVETVKRALQLL